MTSTSSAAPFFSPGSPSTPIPDVSSGPATGHGRRNLVIGLASVAVAALTIGGMLYARSASTSVAVTPESHLATGVQVWDAYAPGGSVYRQQVPAQASTVDQSVFSPDGSVYRQQVPSQAGSTDQSIFAPGGSVYNEQVPQQ